MLPEIPRLITARERRFFGGTGMAVRRRELNRIVRECEMHQSSRCLDDGSPTYSAGAAAEVLGTTRFLVMRMVERQELPGFQAPLGLRIPAWSVHQMKETAG